MTKIATRQQLLSDVLVYETPFGHSRTVDTVTVEAGMEAGAVVVLASGKYKWVAAADVATLAADVRIVIDEDVHKKPAGDAQLVTLSNAFGGYAGVTREGLKFKDALSAGQVTTVIGKLAAKNIRATTLI